MSEMKSPQSGKTSLRRKKKSEILIDATKQRPPGGERMIKCKVRFHEGKGMPIGWSCRYGKGPILSYKNVKDGDILEFPESVVRGTNTHCNIPIHNSRLDENGAPVTFVGHREQRLELVPIEW